MEQHQELVSSRGSHSLGRESSFHLESANDQPAKPYSRDYSKVSDQPVHRFGSKGEGEGHFSSPSSVACNSRGEIIVADSDNRRFRCLIEKATSCLS